MVKQQFAVFDIDGTLIRWQLYHAVADALAKAGHIDPDEFAKVRAARMVWKRRARDTSYKDYERALVALHDKAIMNIQHTDYLAAIQRVLDEYKDQTYTYTRELINSLKKNGYLLFAISASQIEIIEPLAKYYGFDDWGGSKYKVAGNKFTGDKQVLKHDRKPALLRKLVKKHEAAFAGSLGVGDSVSDIPMLETVERPIAFNPDSFLFEHARQKTWQIVVERKNVVYKLEPKDGTYLLA